MFDLGLFIRRVGIFGSRGSYEVVVVIIGVGACSRAVGLGVLVSFCRVRGGDFTNSSLGLKV